MRRTIRRHARSLCTPSSSQFRSDQRAASEILGLILAFGIVLVALTTLQVHMVPAENAEIEFKHSQTVQSDFVELRTSVLDAASTKDSQSAEVKLGTYYPARLFFYNPPPVSGTLRTTNPGALSMNQTAGGGVDLADLCGRTKPVTSRSLVYRPSYNELDRNIAIGYDNTLVYHESGGGTLKDTGQRLVRGTRISLYPIVTHYSASGTDAESVTFMANETGTVTYTPPSPLKIELPSTFPDDKWRAILSNEPAVKTVVSTPGDGTVAIVLESGTEYTIQCTPIGVNERPETNSPHTSSRNTTIRDSFGVGGTQTWDGSVDSRTVSQEGGLLRNVTGSDTVELENPITDLSKGSQLYGSEEDNDQYFRMALEIRNSSTNERKYLVMIPKHVDGWHFQGSNLKDNYPVKYYEWDGTDSYTLIHKETIPASDIESWYQGNQDLSVLSYSSAVRNSMDSGTYDLYVARMHGRVEVTIDDTG